MMLFDAAIAATSNLLYHLAVLELARYNVALRGMERHGDTEGW
jgi:hypothetical protein